MQSKLLFSLLFFTVFSSSAAIRYVTKLGAGSQNGTSWSNAFNGNQLQLAINQANSGDEVWVASGTYFPTTTADRTISFSMKNGVIIRGNFNGTETSANQRNQFRTPSTILSGDIGTLNNKTDNTYHVIHNTNIDATALLESFVITDANETRAASGSEGLGGGIYNDGSSGKNCSPLFSRCVIMNNHAFFGGGVFNNGAYGGRSNPMFEACVIINNSAAGGGGGMDNFGLGGEASPHLVNCLIVKNTAETAGGIYNWGGNNNGKANPLFEHCLIAHNSATNGNAGGIIADNSDSGGANSSGESTPIFVNSILQNNTSSMIGPQFYCKGTATLEATYSVVDTVLQRGNHVISNAANIIYQKAIFDNSNDPEGIDNNWFSKDDGYALKPTLTGENFSIDNAIDIPSIQTDITGLARVYGSAADFGPYELIYSDVSTFSQNSFEIYPNPASDLLRVKSSKQMELSLFSLAGVKIASFALLSGVNTIHLQQLSSGSYLLLDEVSKTYQKLIIE